MWRQGLRLLSFYSVLQLLLHWDHPGEVLLVGCSAQKRKCWILGILPLDMLLAVGLGKFICQTR